MTKPQKRKTAAKAKSSTKNEASIDEPPSKKKHKPTMEEEEDVEMDVDDDRHSPGDRLNIIEADVVAAEKDFEHWKQNGGTFDIAAHMRRCNEDLDKVYPPSDPANYDKNEISDWKRRLERIIMEYKVMCEKQDQLSSSDRPNVLANDLMQKVFSKAKAAPMHNANGKATVIASSSTISVPPMSPVKPRKGDKTKLLSQTNNQSKAIDAKQGPTDAKTTAVEEQNAQVEQVHELKKQWYRSMALLTILLILGIALIAASMMTSPKTSTVNRAKLPIDPNNVACRVLPSGRQECFDMSSGTPVAVPATRDETEQVSEVSNQEQPTVEEVEDATFISESVEEPYPESNVDASVAAPTDNVVPLATLYSNAAYAAASGDLELLQSFLDANPELVQFTDSNGWTLLHEAARMGHTHLVEYLLHSRGANIDARTTQGQTVLDIALYKLMDESHPTIIVLKQVMGMIQAQDDNVSSDSVDETDATDVAEEPVILEANLVEPDAMDAPDPQSNDAEGASEAESPPTVVEPLDPNAMEPGEPDSPVHTDDVEEVDEEENEEDEEEVSDEELGEEEGDEEDEEPLGYAQELITHGDAEELQRVLESHPDLIYEVDPITGYSLLHLAAQFDHTLDCMRVLLDAGVDLMYAPDALTGTALDVAMTAHPHNMQHPIIVMLQVEAMRLGSEAGGSAEEEEQEYAADETTDDAEEEMDIPEEDDVAEALKENAAPVGVEIPSKSDDELLAEALREFDAMQQG